MKISVLRLIVLFLERTTVVVTQRALDTFIIIIIIITVQERVGAHEYSPQYTRTRCPPYPRSLAAMLSGTRWYRNRVPLSVLQKNVDASSAAGVQAARPQQPTTTTAAAAAAGWTAVATRQPPATTYKPISWLPVRPERQRPKPPQPTVVV